MKNYLIIGGSSGIGKTISETLASTGNHVTATYFKSKVSSNNIHFYPLDVVQQELDLSFSPNKIDGLVYCVGRIVLKPFERIRISDYQEDYAIQVLGAIKVIQAVLPRIKASGLASIVLFSTVAVQTGFAYHSIVSSSKGAIEGLTKSLAAEFAPNIRVNCIAPSISDTPQTEKLLNSDTKKEASVIRHPLKRIGKAEDLAEMAIFLLSDKASWITGQVFHVDGGISTIRA